MHKDGNKRSSRSLHTRRRFLQAGAGALVGAPAFLRMRPASAASLALTVRPSQSKKPVPVDFTGLSYESAQLAHPGFFSPSNTELAGFVRCLGSRGVLRLGGNTSAFTVWSKGTGAPGVADGVGVSPDTGGTTPRRTVVTPEAVRNLAAFAKAVGWQLVYGLNLATGTPREAADEAQAVCEAAGSNLLALQLGNEPDLFSKKAHRPAGWGFADYLVEWQEFARAIKSRVPNAPLAAPDIANDPRWISSFAERAKNEIVMLTGHHYALGPPTDPSMTIARLLNPSAALRRDVPFIQKASRESDLPFRMAETNSCFHGGKLGVSNTFAAALWCGDYMLALAQAGFAGVNLHGGGNGIYTPIAGHLREGFSARPVYYGMLLATQFAGTALLSADLATQGLNATAYVAEGSGDLRIAVFNKEDQTPVRLEVKPSHDPHEASLWRLTAPALESTGEVTLAGAEVGRAGAWAPARAEASAVQRGRVLIDVPPASASLLFIR